MAWKAALKLTLDSSGVTTGLKATQSGLDKTTAAAKNLAAGMHTVNASSRNAAGGAGKWADIAGKLHVASFAMKGLGLAAAGVKSVFNSEASFENIVRGLAASSDGSETLREELTNLKETAKLPGLGFREAIQGAAAIKTMGLNAKEARGFLEGVGNALANAGKGKAELDAVIMAFQSMVSQGQIDMDNLKEISTRIPGFLQLTAGIDKSNPLEFVKAAVEQLKTLPPAAESAQDKLDNLKDSVDQARLGLTGGKGAGIGGAVATQLGNLVTGKGFSVGEIFDASTEGDAISKYEPSQTELDRRKAQKLASEAAVKEAKLAAANAVFDAQTKELDMELDLQRAKQAGDKQALQALEDEQFLAQNVAKLVKEMGVDEFTVTERLKEQLALKHMIAAEAEKAAGKKAMDEAKQSTEVEALRSRGKNKAADRLAEKQTQAARLKELTGQGVNAGDAQAQVDAEARVRKDQAYLEKTGRVKTRGAQSRQGMTGLDAFGFGRKEGPAFDVELLDTNPKGGVARERSTQRSPLNGRRADRMAAMGTGARRTNAAQGGQGVGEKAAALFLKMFPDLVRDIKTTAAKPAP